MLSENRDSFISSFSICVFYFFFLTYCFVRNTLSNSDESGHSYLVPHMKKKALSVIIKNDGSYRFFVDLYKVEEFHLCSYFFVLCLLFNDEWALDLCASLDHMISSLACLDDRLIDF